MRVMKLPVSKSRPASYPGCPIRRIGMFRKLYVALLAAPLLTACVVVPDRHGDGFAIAPALPLVVELGVEPYYYHSGYYYYYSNNNWSYSNAKTGPWRELPRDRYPREVRSRGHGDDRGRGRDRDRRYWD
jgi:hypothetical protein